MKNFRVNYIMRCKRAPINSIYHYGLRAKRSSDLFSPPFFNNSSSNTNKTTCDETFYHATCC